MTRVTENTDLSFLDELLKHPTLGIHFESVMEDESEDVFRARVEEVTLATKDHLYMIDVRAVDIFPMLKDLMEGPTVKLFHRAKWQVKFLLHHYGIRPKNIFCFHIAARLLAMGHFRGSMSFKAIAARYLGNDAEVGRPIDVHAMDDSQETGVSPSTFHRLYERMNGLIQKNKLNKVCQLECRTIVPLAAIEVRGLVVDQERVKEAHSNYKKQMEALEERLGDELRNPNDLPGMNTLNLMAHEQVHEALRNRGLDLPDTADRTLKAYVKDYPFLGDLLKFRHTQKIVTALSSQLMHSINARTKRIHPTYTQIASASGRMACANPNIQQIPREKDVRRCIVPAKGYVFVIADYSQVELRVAAGLSKDPIMTNAYASNQDLHRLTAALTMDKAVEAVSNQERQAAKAINFGLIYAMGANGLRASAKRSYGVELSEQEAIQFRERFFGHYKGIANWQKELSRLGRQQNFVRTRAGRIRSYKDQDIRITELLNVPVQGTAAEGLKSAMCIFWDKVHEDAIDAHMIALIHDEIIVEVREDQATWAKEVLEVAMVRGISWLVPEVSFDVEAHIADSWAEK